MKVTTSLGTRKERFSRKATYDFQLEAFVAAVEDGASFPTTAADAIRTMELIDAIYTAAGLPRAPTHPGRADAARAADEPLAAVTRRDAALDAAAGCQAAELRVERIRSQTVRLHDAQPETTADDTDFGMGVRVVVDGAVGLRRHGRRAAGGGGQPRPPGPGDGHASPARPGAAASSWRPSPRTARCTWSSAFEVDPSTVPMADKIALLAEWSRRLGDHEVGVAHVGARCSPCRSRPTWPTSTGRGPPSTGCACRASSRRSRSRTRLRDDAHAGAAGRPRLGVPDRPGRPTATGTGTPSWPSCPSCWPRSWPRPRCEAGTLRPRRRPVEPVAHHPRVDRARHRARPGRRLRGGLRRDLVRHLRQARHARATAPPSCT